MRIGRLIPWTLVLAFALDAATRMIPIDMFSFRAWETLHIAMGPTGPFEPDRVYANPLTYGDLSRARRYSHLRQHHLEYFSTDNWGFRNTVSGSQSRAVGWLLIGDSFGVSSGVTDGNSLASQVARWSGERVYNASADVPLPFNDIRFTSERLGMKEGGVIYEFMERQEMPTVAAAGASRLFADGPPLPRRRLSERYRAWREDAKVGRLRILAEWGWEAIAAKIGAEPADASSQQPTDLPTVSYELANGKTMLFYGKDIDVTRDPNRQISASYLVWLKSELAKLNLHLVVLLVPNKYSVYGPLVKDPSAPRPSGLPLQRLADSLKAHDVSVVNVSEALREQAASDLPQNEYVFFVDDTHWNERGIGVAAQALVEALKAR
jgi:acetyltransferase AlgX (SGNH hydrolase-like protein)